MAMYDNYLSAIKESAAANTAQSQAFAREQMKFNAEQAALNRQWQEEMSNTAHQREVKDLIAAGLNPVLSTGGTGAATPSGATATGASGKVDESYSSALMSYVTTLINSATQITASNLSANAVLGAAAASASAARYSADVGYASNKYSQDMAYKIKQDFPTNAYSAVGSVLSRLNIPGFGQAKSYTSAREDYAKGHNDLLSKLINYNNKYGARR